MSHEFESGVFNRVPAWHGLGVVYNEEEKLTPRKAIKIANLDWNVSKKPIFLGDGTKIPGKFATVRESDNKPFGIVGSRYNVIQNQDGFDYLSDLVDDGEIEIETAISLYEGKVVTIVAKRPEHVLVAGEEVEEWLVFTNPHDGSGAAKVFFTPIRIVCANTQNYALSSVKNYYNIRHSGDVIGKLNDARVAINMSFQYTQDVKNLGEELATRKITGKGFMSFLDRLVPVPNKEKHPRAHRNAENRRSNIGRIFKYSENLENIRFTKWGALQSVVEYTNHSVNYKNKRFEKILDGPELNQKALEILTA